MATVKRLQIGLLIFCVMFVGVALDAAAQNKIVVIPLMSDGVTVTCTGTLVGTRWCDNHDSTVTDMTTGLVWLKYADWGGAKPWRSDTPGNYDDAYARASSLQDGVYLRMGPYFSIFLEDGSADGEWRLPTVSELYHLANGSEAVRSENMRAFSGVKSNDYDHYWSSSTLGIYPYDQYALVVNMGDGSWYSKPKASSSYICVWPVRGGK